jgi:quinol-cytochrome oxidoreductase complex cytochrome b subunit
MAKPLMLLLQDAFPFAANVKASARVRSKHCIPQWPILVQYKSLVATLDCSSVVTHINSQAMLEET